MNRQEQIVNLRAQRTLEPDSAACRDLFFSALGCRTTWLFCGYVHVNEPVLPDPQDEPFIAATLIDLLEEFVPTVEDASPMDHYYLIDGLCKNDRWRMCLSSEKLTYGFAALLLHFCYMLKRLPSSRSLAMVKDVKSVLVDWLSPDRDWSPQPSVEDAARAMFGDAWWSFTGDNENAGQLDHGANAYHIVLSTHPPFLPRVTSTPVRNEAARLPLCELPDLY